MIVQYVFKMPLNGLVGEEYTKYWSRIFHWINVRTAKGPCWLSHLTNMCFYFHIAAHD